MNWKSEILARFSGEPRPDPLFLPDLVLWYEWHRDQGTLPEAWEGYALPQVARAMGFPIWLPVRPWRLETPGIEIKVTTGEGDEVRTQQFHTPLGTLTARWTLGPDGDWWQTEYPVKTEDDLLAALELVKARTLVLDAAELSRWQELVGEDGVVALELPRRPYADLLHDLLGWSQGLMFLNRPVVQEINDILEQKLQDLVEEVASLPGQMVLSPDNLDGQFISPRAFEENLAQSYRRTVDVLRQQDKYLVVHVGGPIQHLLGPLARAGVDGLEGVAGPPQSDLTLAQARGAVGPQITLWGGIPQDFVVETHEEQRFAAAVRQAAQDARGDGRMLVGVADRVPVNADLDRLQAIPALLGKKRSGKSGG